MSVDDTLKAKIAEMEARLGRQKPPPQTAPFAPYPQFQGQKYHQTQPAYRGGRGYFNQRFASRGGRETFQGTHRNNTLIVNKPSAPEQSKDSGGGKPEDLSQVHVQKRGYNQLINKPSTDRNEEQHSRDESLRIAGSKSQAAEQATDKRKEETEEAKPRVIVKANQELEINDISFRMARDGSKMERIDAGQSNHSHKHKFSGLMFSTGLADGPETPKKLVLHGVAYHRTKKGNLRRKQDNKPIARSGPKKQCETFSKKGIYRHNLHHSGHARRPDYHNLQACCCPRGIKCRFDHDPDKVAVCKTHLFTGSCDKGIDCDFSHDTTYARAPACTFFASGNCTNPACRYPHVKVSSTAPLCISFGRLGYCAKGDRCEKRHIFDECPEYTNTGNCKLLKANKKCELQHIDRASTMRKREQRAVEHADEDVSDSEQEDEDEAATDSDGFEEDDVVMTGTDNDNSHELSQQQDFVSFE